MPRDDQNLPFVREALQRAGWQVGTYPYIITYGGRRGIADIDASLLSASTTTRQIVVEVKDFQSASIVADLEQAVGQYLVYLSWLRRTEPRRELWLAIDQRAEQLVFNKPFGNAILQDYPLRLLIIDITRRSIVSWR